MVNYSVSDQSLGGKVYIQNNAQLVFTDDGTTYSASIRTDPIDFGTRNRKFWEEVEVIGDLQESASAIAISYSDDDYQSWTTVSGLDLSSDRTRALRLGSSRRRAWGITHSADTPMRVEALELRYSDGVI